MDSKEAEETRKELSERHDKVWSTDEMREEFEVLGFCNYLCVVRRKKDGVKGTLDFTHMPRFYFDFQEA